MVTTETIEQLQKSIEDIAKQCTDQDSTRIHGPSFKAGVARLCKLHPTATSHVLQKCLANTSMAVQAYSVGTLYRQDSSDRVVTIALQQTKGHMIEVPTSDDGAIPELEILQTYTSDTFGFPGDKRRITHGEIATAIVQAGAALQVMPTIPPTANGDKARWGRSAPSHEVFLPQHSKVLP